MVCGGSGSTLILRDIRAETSPQSAGFAADSRADTGGATILVRKGQRAHLRGALDWLASMDRGSRSQQGNAEVARWKAALRQSLVQVSGLFAWSRR